MPTSPRKPKRRLSALVLAAGEGTRMRSRLAKVLHPLAGRPMIRHVLDAARAAGAEQLVVVVGAQAEAVRDELAGQHDVRLVEQKRRRGTGDAVRVAEKALARLSGDLLILCGDVPLLTAATLKKLVARHRRTGAALTVLSASLDDPGGYGRVVRDGRSVTAIVEHGDATREQRALREINTGTFAARIPDLLWAVRRLRPRNRQKEYYLTDALGLLLGAGEKVSALETPHPDEALGVNSMAQLAEAEAVLNRRILDRLMESGVRILDPATTRVDPQVKVGRDTVLYPGVTLEGETTIGTGCRIHSGTRLRDTRMEKDAVVLDHCVLLESRVGTGAQVGPFAHLRPGSVLGAGVKVGNFVETKKAVLGKGSKASHLAYLGDARIGREVNVGAGTITCNYDGEAKHETRLDDGVFIGSDSQLVAPVTVGRGAYVGAGSTINKDVPPGALAISRARQTNIEGWATRRKRSRKKSGPKGGR